MIRQVPGPPSLPVFLQKCTTAIIVVRFPAFNNVLEVVIYTNANCNTFTDKWAIQETAELDQKWCVWYRCGRYALLCIKVDLANHAN